MIPSKVLITGGTGFIGANLARKLIDKNIEVTLFDLSPNKRRISDILDNVFIVSGDVSDWRKLETLFKENSYDVIVHAAAILSMKAEEDKFLTFRTNIEGTFNIFEAIRRFSIGKIIYLSSMSVFGPNSTVPYGEYSYRDPTSFYGVSKVWGEILGTYYSFAYGINFRCIRLPTVFGPGRRGLGATVSFSRLVEDIALKHRGVVKLPRYTMNPVIYIDDAIDMIYRLILSETASKKIYNAGGVLLSMEMIIDYLKEKFPDAETIFDIDETAEKVGTMWTILSQVAKENGLDKLYREYKDIRWRLKYDTYDKILNKYLEDVEKFRFILLNI